MWCCPLQVRHVTACLTCSYMSDKKCCCCFLIYGAEEWDSISRNTHACDWTPYNGGLHFALCGCSVYSVLVLPQAPDGAATSFCFGCVMGPICPLKSCLMAGRQQHESKHARKESQWAKQPWHHPTTLTSTINVRNIKGSKEKCFATEALKPIGSWKTKFRLLFFLTLLVMFQISK